MSRIALDELSVERPTDARRAAHRWLRSGCSGQTKGGGDVAARWGLVASVAVVGVAGAALGGRVGCGPLGSVPESRAVAAATAAAADRSVDARLLLVGADGHEAALQAMRAELDYMGIPYTQVAAAALAGTTLADGPSHGLYNGAILTACAGGAPRTPPPRPR